MGAPTTATVGLKSTFHWTPDRVMTPWRNLNRNERRKEVSNVIGILVFAIVSILTVR